MFSSAAAPIHNSCVAHVLHRGQCRSLKGQELQVALENITTYWEGMPKADNVLCLLASGMVVPVSAFLELFDTPVDLDLESEKVWPVPRLPALKGGG